MPLKPKPSKRADQLDLFDYASRNDSHAVRTDGRTPLAGISSHESAGTGNQGTAPGSSLRGGRKDEGRNGPGHAGLSETGIHASAGPRHRVGNRPREVHPSSSRTAVAHNSQNY